MFDHFGSSCKPWQIVMFAAGQEEQVKDRKYFEASQQNRAK